MKQSLLISIFLFITFWTCGQTSRGQFLGINVWQFPALTINANYSIEAMPYLTPIVDIGYALNYEKSFDFIGKILTSHCKCNNDGYNILNRTGPYLKIGTFLNLRRSFKKQNFFHLGLFFNNSFVNESGNYRPEEENVSVIQPVSHSVYIPGFSFSGGFEFSILKKMKSNIDFQISLPGNTHKDLYGYRNYIPGMGYRDAEIYWFPMLLWNFKYRL